MKDIPAREEGRKVYPGEREDGDLLQNLWPGTRGRKEI